MRWFGHVQRRLVTAPVRKSLAMKVDDPSRRGKSKRTRLEVVKMDMRKCNLPDNLAQDRSEWRKRIRVVGSNIVGTRL